jgi:hypothetical protein
MNASEFSGDDLVVVYSSASEVYFADDNWGEAANQAGFRCPRSLRRRPNPVNVPMKVVLSHVPKHVYVGVIARLGGCLIVHSDLIQHFVPEWLESHCYILPTYDQAGRHLVNLSCVFRKRDEEIIRGPADSKVCLCGVCGGLGYSPAGGQYLLREYWPGGLGLKVVSDEVICTRAFFDEVIKPMGLKRLVSERLPLREEPIDGLPAPYVELVAEVRRRGWVTPSGA